MANETLKIGFGYFSAPDYQVSQQWKTWLPLLRKWGGSYIIFQADFDLAVPEDLFVGALNNGLEPYVHFSTALPSARSFNDASFLLDLYQKWGVNYVILGDQPNTKQAWPLAGWHYETLVDHFLDRFIPLANYAVRIGLCPVMAPLQPGGDYWDDAFLELLLNGLKTRKMDRILEKLTLASYGFTFQKPLSWGAGGPERWPGTKPYFTPEGQEDQIGFHNFEWSQAAGQRICGEKMPVLIMDAGRPGPALNVVAMDTDIETLQHIVAACRQTLQQNEVAEMGYPEFNDQVIGCTFNLDTMRTLMVDHFSLAAIEAIFGRSQTGDEGKASDLGNPKYLSHYLLLPFHASGVSEVVLNKVKPLIKQLRPTVGFSLTEASFAAKVSIFPDPYVFSDEQINGLRSAGCEVEILPDSGIDIATQLLSKIVD